MVKPFKYFSHGTKNAGKQPTLSSEHPYGEKSVSIYGLRAGSEFLGGTLTGIFLGWIIDIWLQTSPTGILVGLPVGFAVGLWNMYKLLITAPNLQEKKTAATKNNKQNVFTKNN